jgi:hypothetical protein
MRNWIPSNWREYVVWLLFTLLMAALSFFAGTSWAPSPPPVPVFKAEPVDSAEHGQGWVADPDAVAAIAAQQPVKVFADTPAYRAGDTDTDPFLWNAWNKAIGNLPPPRDQGPIGSCVSFGTTAAVDCLIAISFVAGHTGEYHDPVQEAVYGGSRVQIGGGKIHGDGSVGAWAAQWVKQYGVIARGKLGSYDLTTYSVSRCRDWGNRGCPKDLEPEARLHPVKGITQCKSAEEIKRALQNGYPVAVCSNQGFASVRDADGFARPQGSWAHCMAALGYRVDRKGFFIWNSWGAGWIRGPLGPGNPPEGGFWCDWQTMDRMARAGDTWAFSDVVGWGARKLDWFVQRSRRSQPRLPVLAALLEPRSLRHAYVD